MSDLDARVAKLEQQMALILSTPASTAAARVSVRRQASSCQEVIDYCIAQGLASNDGIYLWEKWQNNRWMNAGAKIRDWKGVVRQWKAGGFMPSQKQFRPPGQATSPNGKRERWKIEADLASVKQSRDRLRIKIDGQVRSKLGSSTHAEQAEKWRTLGDKEDLKNYDFLKTRLDELEKELLRA